MYVLSGLSGAFLKLTKMLPSSPLGYSFGAYGTAPQQDPAESQYTRNLRNGICRIGQMLSNAQEYDHVHRAVRKRKRFVQIVLVYPIIAEAGKRLFIHTPIHSDPLYTFSVAEIGFYLAFRTTCV